MEPAFLQILNSKAYHPSSSSHTYSVKPYFNTFYLGLCIDLLMRLLERLQLNLLQKKQI